MGLTRLGGFLRRHWRIALTGFVTNDPIFERVQGFETIVLDKLL